MAIKLFYRPTQADLDIDKLVGKIELLDEKTHMMQRTIEVLLLFLKTSALDIKEIETNAFKAELEDLALRITSPERPKRIELHFEQRKNKLLSFIERQKSYIADREKELRDIIDLLTKAMANLDVENHEFYQRVYDQSEKMEQITRLDDIKKIKSALKLEVDQMREIVEYKKDQDKRQVKHLAGQVDALQQELQKARTKSMTDGLTGVYNREAFDSTLGECIERSLVMNTGFALLILDLDDFKTINDTHGHLIGDRVLMAFAKKCKDTVRGDDIVARYGGEEFAVILSGANLRNALAKARQICGAVASARYATCDGGNCEEDYFSVTVSIGVSVFKKGDTAENLIARADKALYKAKRSGKNRAVARKA
jgi:diguanylate cyclase